MVYHTILPISVEARAKMKMTRGQLDEDPLSRSLEVLDSWRVSSSTASTGVGAAEARPAAKVRMLRSFMMKIGCGVCVLLEEGWRAVQKGLLSDADIEMVNRIVVPFYIHPMILRRTSPSPKEDNTHLPMQPVGTKRSHPSSALMRPRASSVWPILAHTPSLS